MTGLLTNKIGSKKSLTTTTHGATPLSKNIKSSKAFDDDKGVSAFYIINYEEGGCYLI